MKKTEKDSLPAKYRPKTWGEIIGKKNQETCKILRSAIRDGNVHLFLLTGPSGCGKTTVARLIKEALTCANEDFTELNGGNDRGIETIRQIIHEQEYFPLQGEVKVILIDECHRLTKDSWEALLKVTEEPAPGTYFILATTNPEKIPDTMINRCGGPSGAYTVYAVDRDEMTPFLKAINKKEGEGVPINVITEVVTQASGSPREALVLFEKVMKLEGEKEMLKAIGDETIVETPQAPLHRNLLYPTFHLKYFDYLDRGMGLYGKGYTLPIKAIWYVLHGQIIKTKIVNLGEVETDCRMNFAFILKPGLGKKEIEDTITGVCNSLGEKVTKPTSYHPESLVGKVVQKKGEYRQIRGHLGDDILIFDDAVELVKSQKALYRESRKYIIEALDQVGKNLITKRPTGIPREEALEYYPTCSMQILLQPFKISEEVVESGFFRRFLFLLPEIKLYKEIFSQRTQSKGMPKSQALKTVLDHLKELKEKGSSSELTFSKEAISRFNELYSLLVEYGEKYSKRVSRHTDMIKFPLQNLFLKMIAILANSDKRTEVSIFDVEMAFVDLLEFLDSNFEYVKQKVEGSLDYGGKSQPTADDFEMIEWLKEKGALSYDASDISIGTYINKISSKFQVTPEGARNRYRKHVSKGWIKTKQENAVTRVWLAFEYDEDEGGKGGKGGRVVAEYQNIITQYAEGKPIPLLPGKEILQLPWFPLIRDTIPPYHSTTLIDSRMCSEGS